jgi:hypothetical protein
MTLNCTGTPDSPATRYPAERHDRRLHELHLQPWQIPSSLWWQQLQDNALAAPAGDKRTRQRAHWCPGRGDDAGAGTTGTTPGLDRASILPLCP